MTQYKVQEGNNVLYTGTFEGCWLYLVQNHGAKTLAEIASDALGIFPVAHDCLVIREIVGEERKEVIENNLYDEDQPAKVLRVFGVPSEEYGDLVFFEDNDGHFHTVVERDSIYTRDLGEMISFIKKYV